MDTTVPYPTRVAASDFLRCRLLPWIQLAGNNGANQLLRGLHPFLLLICLLEAGDPSKLDWLCFCADTAYRLVGDTVPMNRSVSHTEVSN